MCVYLFAPSRGQPLCFSLFIIIVYTDSTPGFHLKSINCIIKVIMKDKIKYVLAEVFGLIIQFICNLPRAGRFIF